MSTASQLCCLRLIPLQASEIRNRRQNFMANFSHDMVVDIKGPGQLVGEVVMEEQPPPSAYSARARGEVVALKLTQENYIRALAAMYREAESGARATVGPMMSANGAGRAGPVSAGGGPSGRGQMGSRMGRMGSGAGGLPRTADFDEDEWGNTPSQGLSGAMSSRRSADEGAGAYSGAIARAAPSSMEAEGDALLLGPR